MTQQGDGETATYETALFHFFSLFFFFFLSVGEAQDNVKMYPGGWLQSHSPTPRSASVKDNLKEDIRRYEKDTKTKQQLNHPFSRMKTKNCEKRKL